MDQESAINVYTIVSNGHDSCTRDLVWYSTKKTHCFQSYNQGYRKTGNN